MKDYTPMQMVAGNNGDFFVVGVDQDLWVNVIVLFTPRKYFITTIQSTFGTILESTLMFLMELQFFPKKKLSLFTEGTQQFTMYLLRYT